MRMATRLEQALKWWRYGDEQPIPPRHYAALMHRRLLEFNPDGEVCRLAFEKLSCREREIVGGREGAR